MFTKAPCHRPVQQTSDASQNELTCIPHISQPTWDTHQAKLNTRVRDGGCVRCISLTTKKHVAHRGECTMNRKESQHCIAYALFAVFERSGKRRMGTDAICHGFGQQFNWTEVA